MFEFETTFNTRGKKMPQRSDETAQYTILLCGPFAGDSPTPFDIPRKVDMDSIEAIMEIVAPSGTIAGQKMTFRKPIDFEPLMVADANPNAKLWFSRLEAVRAGGPKCSAAIESMADLESPAPLSDEPEALEPKEEEGKSSFESLLGGSTTVSSEPTRMPTNSIVDKLISDSLQSSPGSVPEDMDEILNAIADQLGDTLRDVYHDPVYRIIEGTWLGMNDMIGDFDSDDPVQFMLMPFSNEDWVTFLGSDDNSDTLRKRLAETCPGRPDIVVTTETLSGDDTSMVKHIGLKLLSELLQSPVIANIDFDVLLRQKPSGPVTVTDLIETAPFPLSEQKVSGPCVRLATPCFRQRLPYGEDRNPAGSFVFEEFLQDSPPSILPWAPASLLCAYAWSSKFREEEEDVNWNEVTQMAGFPPMTTDTSTLPSTEYILTERAMAHLYSLGCLPVTAMANSDRILVGA